MTHGSYIDQIAEKIAYHRREIERLEIAHGVLMEMSGKQLAPEPMFTVRKIAASEPKAETQPKAAGKPGNKRSGQDFEKRREKKRVIRERLIAELAKTPGTSGEIAKRLDLDSDAKQQLYQIVYELNKSGILDKADDGSFSLSKAAQQAMPETGKRVE